jgi:hypothetical protein
MASNEWERAERATAAIREMASLRVLRRSEAPSVTGSHLERAEQAIAAIRDHREVPSDIVQALEEIVHAIGSVDRRVATLAPTGILFPENHVDPAKEILGLLGEP